VAYLFALEPNPDLVAGEDLYDTGVHALVIARNDAHEIARMDALWPEGDQLLVQISHVSLPPVLVPRQHHHLLRVVYPMQPRRSV
jgi:hypothetical protein